MFDGIYGVVFILSNTLKPIIIQAQVACKQGNELVPATYQIPVLASLWPVKISGHLS